MNQKAKSLDDVLLFSTFQYYSVPFLYLFIAFVIQQYQNPWIALWIIYTFIPALDEIASIDVRNPTKQEAAQLDTQLKYKLPLYISLISEWLLAVWMIEYLASHEVGLLNTLGIVFVCGNLAGSNINVAHELVHRDDFMDKTLGTLALARNLYMHFAIEHVFGHHRHVSTPQDPATSKRGQSVYQFYYQTIIGSYKSAWRFENQQMTKRFGKAIVPQNKMVWYTACYFILPFAVYLLYGTWGAIYFVGSAIIGVFFLETVNYIEHYGLSRKELSPGVFEPVDIRHSWNAPHRLSNYLLFKLQRHSDHHENPYKPYQNLCSYDESPCLPHGYTVCVALAWFPSQWFEIMNQRLEEWNQKDERILVKNHKSNAKLKKFLLKLTLVTTSVAALSVIL